MGNDLSYQDFSACSSGSGHPAGSRVSFAYTPSNLSGSAPSLKTPPTQPRLKSASSARSTSAAVSASSANHMPTHRAVNDVNVTSTVATTGDKNMAKMSNGRPTSGNVVKERVRLTASYDSAAVGVPSGTTATTASTAAALTDTSSSDFSESDNEVAFVRNSRHRDSRNTESSVEHATDMTSLPESCMCSCHTGSRDVIDSLRGELRSAKLELSKCRDQLATLRQNDTQLRQRLSEQARRQLEKSTTKFEDLSLGDRRPTQLIRRYGNLYTDGRLEALDALDDVTEMTEFTDLKGKLLLTILVLSFRMARKSHLGVKLQVRHLLHIPEVLSPAQNLDASTAADALVLDPAVRELDDVISVYLRRTVDRFDLSRNFEEVCQRVWDTLYDFPRLRQCSGLLRYIDECVRLAWSLTVQNPPFCIQYEHTRYSADLHTRFHTSNPSSDVIRAVLWPALTEGETGQCAYKGVVIT